MEIPEKEACYWFKESKSGWQLMEVSSDHVMCQGGYYYTRKRFSEKFQGEFGRAIPSNDQIDAMREAVRKADAVVLTTNLLIDRIDSVGSDAPKCLWEMALIVGKDLVALNAARAKVEMGEQR